MPIICISTVASRRSRASGGMTLCSWPRTMTVGRSASGSSISRTASSAAEGEDAGAALRSRRASQRVGDVVHVGGSTTCPRSEGLRVQDSRGTPTARPRRRCGAGAEVGAVQRPQRGRQRCPQQGWECRRRRRRISRRGEVRMARRRRGRPRIARGRAPSRSVMRRGASRRTRAIVEGRCPWWGDVDDTGGPLVLVTRLRRRTSVPPRPSWTMRWVRRRGRARRAPAPGRGVGRRGARRRGGAGGAGRPDPARPGPRPARRPRRRLRGRPPRRGPTLIKENTDVAGWPATNGAPPTSPCLPRPTPRSPGSSSTSASSSSAPPDAGVGLNASTEFVDAEPTRNPWNTDYSAGASSGGSAALVAAAPSRSPTPTTAAGPSASRPPRAGSSGSSRPAAGRAQRPGPADADQPGQRRRRDPLGPRHRRRPRRDRPPPSRPGPAADRPRRRPARRRLRIGLVLESPAAGPSTPDPRRRPGHRGGARKPGPPRRAAHPRRRTQFVDDFLVYWGLLAAGIVAGGRFGSRISTRSASTRSPTGCTDTS